MRHPTSLRASSWSWASLDGSVIYPHKISSDRVENALVPKAIFLGMKNQAGDDVSAPPGREIWLNGTGTLILRAAILEAVVPEPFGEGPRLLLKSRREMAGLESKTTYSHCHLDEKKNEDTTYVDVFCAEIAKDSFMRTYVLLLQQVSDVPNSHTYRRVGLGIAQEQEFDFSTWCACNSGPVALQGQWGVEPACNMFCSRATISIV
jgi:hypothetical protein